MDKAIVHTRARLISIVVAAFLNVGLSPAGSSLVGDSGASVPGSVAEPGAAEGA